jgi:hypothetical protein
MKTLQLAMAGLTALGAALVAAPEPASAGYGYGYGRPSYGYGYGYYRRPVVKKVVVVRQPYYPVYYRPSYRRVVYSYPRRHYGYGGYGRRGYGYGW